MELHIHTVRLWAIWIIDKDQSQGNSGGQQRLRSGCVDVQADGMFVIYWWKPDIIT